VVAPSGSGLTRIRVPGNAYPIEFQPLYLELGSAVFKVRVRPDVTCVPQEPVHRVYGYPHIDSMWLKTHRL
jgi:hypothetical protein